MIHICQGHEKSIGLEILLKCLLTIPTDSLKLFCLHVNEDTLCNHLLMLNVKYSLKDSFLCFNNRTLKVYTNKNNKLSQTLTSLDSAINEIKSNDILLTLPSSKDQFLKENKNYHGHTEYFRYLYAKDEISMVFLSKKLNVLLLSDHIPLEKVSKHLTVERIVKKISTTLVHLKKIKDIKNVYISGINPHCGEDGLMGDEDLNITNAIHILTSDFPHTSFSGPIPGDTIYFNNTSAKTDLLVYAHHDQGLSLFKSLNGLVGINTSFGMDYLRVSPDHGTAFDLHGKNEANYQGMLFLLNEILNWN